MSVPLRVLLVEDKDIWGRTCESLYQNPHSWLETIYVEDCEPADAILAAPLRGEQNDAERPIIRPDGSIRWISGRAFPIFDKAGQLSCIVGVAQDITDRKRDEEAQRQSEERYRMLFESSRDGIVSLTWTAEFSRSMQPTR